MTSPRPLPELLLVGAPGGLSTHLLHHVDMVLCRGLKGNVTVGPTTTPFALLGCRRCARAAMKLGYTEIVDVDGERVVLDGFTPIV